MVRIIGVDIPDKKRLEISLTYIFGIGRQLALEVIRKLKLEPGMKACDLSETQIAQLNALIQTDYKVEGDLRREVQGNINRLVKIKCYRGSRHRAGLPVRGQATQTNARTRKGKRKTIANKKI